MSQDDCNPIQCALEAIEDAGLSLHKVGIFTRKWSGDKLGMGRFKDSVEYFKPAPRIREIDTEYRLKEGGTQKRGDIMIRLIPKNQYPNKSDLECESSVDNEEKYYFIDGSLYEVISIKEKLYHWNVTVRRTKKRKLKLEGN